MSVGDERLAMLREEVERLRTQTANPLHRSPAGIVESRYDRVLDGVEKVLNDHASEIVRGNEVFQYQEVVLWAFDVLGFDTEEWGWAPHRERAERMGW